MASGTGVCNSSSNRTFRRLDIATDSAAVGGRSLLCQNARDFGYLFGGQVDGMNDSRQAVIDPLHGALPRCNSLGATIHGAANGLDPFDRGFHRLAAATAGMVGFGHAGDGFFRRGGNALGLNINLVQLADHLGARAARVRVDADKDALYPMIAGFYRSTVPVRQRFGLGAAPSCG